MQNSTSGQTILIILAIEKLNTKYLTSTINKMLKIYKPLI